MSRGKLTEMTGVRLDDQTIERLEDLAKVLALPGQRPARSNAVLATIFAGLKAFEADPSLLE